MPATGELDGPGGGRHDDRVADPDAHLPCPRAGRITAPPASIAASAVVRSPAVNVEPAVRREVGAADRDGVEAGAVEGEVERRDRRRPGHAVDRRDLRSVAVARRSAPARSP